MAESEKVTINMSAVDLGKVDLLVQEGMYSNRTDFIRTAIRVQLDKHNLEIQQSVARHAYVMGVLSYNNADLEKQRRQGTRLKISVVGLMHLQDDIPIDLALETIESVQVRGIFIVRDELKAALAGRTK